MIEIPNAATASAPVAERMLRLNDNIIALAKEARGVPMRLMSEQAVTTATPIHGLLRQAVLFTGDRNLIEGHYDDARYRLQSLWAALRTGAIAAAQPDRPRWIALREEAVLLLAEVDRLLAAHLLEEAAR